MDANIVAGVEAGEAIRVSRLARRSEVAPDESVSVDRVQREAVYVDVLRRDDFDDQRDSRAHHKVEDNNWRCRRGGVKRVQQGVAEHKKVERD